MRDDEFTVVERFALVVKRTRRGGKAIAKLVDVAERGAGDARYVTALLDVVANLAEGHTANSSPPEAERDVWEAVGADFTDAAAVATAHGRMLEAFADLVERSIRGAPAAADLLKVDRSRVSQRIAERSLFAFSGPDEERCFPLWQFRRNRPLPKLRQVLVSLDPNLHPLTVDHWFTRPNADLTVDEEPVAPAEWIATGGDTERVAALAADV